MKAKKLVISGAICAVLFFSLSFVFMLGVEQRSYTDIRSVESDAPYVYESETLCLVGFSEDDIAFSATAFRGENVYVNVKGETGKLYSITVFNPSGKSSASALVSKRAGEDGMVYWNWKVADNVSDGYIRVIVSGEDKYAQMKIKIA